MRLKLSLLGVLLAFVFISLTHSDEPKTLEEGITYYRQENFDEAGAVLKKARQEDPNSSLAAYYLGLTYKQLQAYKEAKIHLIDAVTLTPKIKGALLELIEVLYYLDEFSEALRYIEIAEKEGIRPAQTAFLKGLVLMKENRNAEAITSLKTAKELDPTLTQTADYQIGLAYLKERSLKKAKEAFGEVAILNPNTDIARFAHQYIEAIERRLEIEKPFKFTVGVAFQYDDNVLLKPGDATVAADITNEDDFREVFTFRGDYDKRFTELLGLKLVYSLYFANQNDLGTYDVLSNTATLMPTLHFKDAFLGFPASYNRTQVGKKDYLSTIGVNPLLNLKLGQSQMLQITLKYQNKDFLRSPINTDENRDANDFAASASLFLFFAENKGFLSLQYEINRDEARGSNWRYLGNKGTIALLLPLLERFKASVSAEIFFQDFTKNHTIYNVERKDSVYTASAMLVYNFFKDTELQLRYTHVRDDSNIVIYDYNRNIYSLGVEYKF